MKNVLIIYSARIPTVEIVCGVVEDLQNKVTIQIKELQIINVQKNDIEWADVILAIRPFEVSAHGIIMSAHKAGKQIVVYLDDDLLHLPHVYSSRLRMLFTVASYKGNCRYLEEILGVCDILWGSSDYLLRMYQPLVNRGRCVCTNLSIDTENFSLNQKAKETIDIVFAGSGNHYKHLNEYIIPAVNQLAEKYPNIVLTLLGTREKNIQDCKVNVVNIPWKEYEEYNSAVRKYDFDIGVAPIEQEDFYRCKYFNKYIEYTSLGAVGIYTNDYPYRIVIKEGFNGLLADNTVESWAKKISYAVENSVARRNMILNAIEHCRENYSREKQVQEILDLIPEMYMENSDSFSKVRFKPKLLINYARKYANKLVAVYEGLRN